MRELLGYVVELCHMKPLETQWHNGTIHPHLPKSLRRHNGIVCSHCAIVPSFSLGFEVAQFAEGCR